MSKLTPEQLAAERTPKPEKAKPAAAPMSSEVCRVIAAMDERGAWVEDGKLRYHGADDPTKRIIDSHTFIKNLGILAHSVAAAQAGGR